jgi:hypothetical protein
MSNNLILMRSTRSHLRMCKPIDPVQRLLPMHEEARLQYQQASTRAEARFLALDVEQLMYKIY